VERTTLPVLRGNLPRSFWNNCRLFLCSRFSGRPWMIARLVAGRNGLVARSTLSNSGVRGESFSDSRLSLC